MQVRYIMVGVLAGAVAGLAAGFFPALETCWWLTHRPAWPLGETVTLAVVWTPFGLAGGSVGALGGRVDYRIGRQTSRLPEDMAAKGST